MCFGIEDVLSLEVPAPFESQNASHLRCFRCHTNRNLTFAPNPPIRIHNAHGTRPWLTTSDLKFLPCEKMCLPCSPLTTCVHCRQPNSANRPVRLMRLTHIVPNTSLRTTRCQGPRFGLRGLTGHPATLTTKPAPFPRLAPSSAPTRVEAEDEGVEPPRPFGRQPLSRRSHYHSANLPLYPHTLVLWTASYAIVHDDVLPRKGGCRYPRTKGSRT